MMDQNKVPEEFSNIQNKVEDWFMQLQYERKCSASSLISRIVNHLSPEKQENIKQLISHKINLLISDCTETKSFEKILEVCNAINGCFDNFAHAAEAVKYSFSQILLFIHYAIDECQSEYLKKRKMKIKVLELLHCLSRILILLLKLRKHQYSEYKNENSIENMYLSHTDLKNEKNDLQLLTHKIVFFLKKDDVLFDTKNNFSICGMLIRQMIDTDEEKLKNYQNELLATIPEVLDKKSSRLSFLQFLISSAIINTWPASIIDEEATFVYLKFFINLCENYSSDTPIVLNASRTLFILIRHKCFENFLLKYDLEKVSQIKKSLISCVFMLLEHPVSCVRHSAKDFLLLLASHSALQDYVIEATFKLPKDKRSFFISMASIAHEMDSRILIEKMQNLPLQILNSIYDPTLVSHVSLALENFILNDSHADNNFESWCELWIIPLLNSLINVQPLIGAEIDKLLEKIFKKHPKSVFYIMAKYNRPSSREELRCIITALKISHKQGFKFKTSSSAFTPEIISSEAGRKGVKCDFYRKSKFLISEKLLMHCLHQGDDEIRISAFSFVVEAQKSTEPYSEEDFRLINYFLKYNLNNHQPATRQKIINLIKKMLVRFSDSRAALLREIKQKRENEFQCSLYTSFLNSLVEFCFSNIFVGCNFNRLNTVLNILVMCFEYIKDMAFNTERTDYYWTKFLVALDSSYEENKELIVILSKKLDYSFLTATNVEVSKALYEKSFCLISHMEPPDVLTGSYLLKILINFPSSNEVLSNYFQKNEEDFDVTFKCIQILAEQFKTQVQLAKLDLMTAAVCAPMYGTLSAIRFIFKDVNFSQFCNETETETEKGKFLLKKWSQMLNDIVQVCFDMIPTVACVVNSSSPEGHLPMDFQTEFQNLKTDLNYEEDNHKKKNEIIKDVFHNFMRKYKTIICNINDSKFDIYETLRSLKCLEKEGNVLIEKLRGSQEKDLLDKIKAARNDIIIISEKLNKGKRIVDWPVTAQVLLLCAWRSIKEASLYFGDFVTKLPIEIGVKINYLEESTLLSIGEELKILLCEIKHRGSFEHVYVGFTQFINSLWKCPWPHFNTKPRQWLEEIAAHLELPIMYQKLKFCSTRRSAGLPFLVQAVICSEITSVKSSTPSSLHEIMRTLLRILAKDIPENLDSKIHALNILRALFKHAQLGEHVSSYISKALMAAIRGSRAPTWSERNSSNLLFSSLMIRIFGVARSKDEILKKNKMTSRTFFQRYSELYEFLLAEIKLAYSIGDGNFRYPKPSLYLILLILGRLYPTPREDAEILDLSEFLPHINLSRRNPVMKIRELAARALVPLIPADRLKSELNDRFVLLRKENNFSQNEIHGILLQIKALLKEWIVTLENSTGKSLGPEKCQWIENTKWILSLEERGDCKKVLSAVISPYLQILHEFFKHFQEVKEEITDIILTCSVFDYFLSIPKIKLKTNLGIHLCLENFYYLKLDVWADICLRMQSSSAQFGPENFISLLIFMLKCKIDEVRIISLKIIYRIFNREDDIELEEDDLAIIGEDLLFCRNKTYILELQSLIVNSAEIFETLLTPIIDDKEQIFKSKMILLLWLRAFSALLTSKNTTKDCTDPLLESSLLQSMKFFLNSEDKQISSSALLIYSIYFLRQPIENNDSIKCREFSLLIRDFSSPEADLKERLAVANVMNYCFDDIMEKDLINVLNLWMIPIKLLLDECITVRHIASNFAYKLQNFLMYKFPSATSHVPMEIFDWPMCNLIHLKSQECLLDFYIKIANEKNYANLFLDMLTMALSSFFDPKEKIGLTNEEFGVFEKGNPNPYYEEVAISNLIACKLSEWKTVINLKDILNLTLDESALKSINRSSQFSFRSPISIHQIIKEIVDSVKDSKNGEFSVLQMQLRNIGNALDLYKGTEFCL